MCAYGGHRIEIPFVDTVYEYALYRGDRRGGCCGCPYSDQSKTFVYPHKTDNLLTLSVGLPT